MHVHTMLRSLPVSDMKIKQIQDTTSGETQMQALIEIIKTGWPEMRQDCPKTVLEYWNYRDKLACAKDIVFKGQKLVSPTSVREEMIKAVHIGHFGVEKSVGRARDLWLYCLPPLQLHSLI